MYDLLGRKFAIIMATLAIVIGAALCTGAHASTPEGFFRFLTVARGLVGVGVGAEYPASSTSASEAANEKLGVGKRGTAFILVTNLPLSFGGPLAVSIFLIVLSATGTVSCLCDRCTYSTLNSGCMSRTISRLCGALALASASFSRLPYFISGFEC